MREPFVVDGFLMLCGAGTAAAPAVFTALFVAGRGCCLVAFAATGNGFFCTAALPVATIFGAAFIAGFFAGADAAEAFVACGLATGFFKGLAAFFAATCCTVFLATGFATGLATAFTGFLAAAFATIFFATGFATTFATGFLPTVFFAAVFACGLAGFLAGLATVLAAAFFAGRNATTFADFATAFLGADFCKTAFLGAAFGAGFLATSLAAGFLATGFFTAVFFTLDFTEGAGLR